MITHFITFYKSVITIRQKVDTWVLSNINVKMDCKSQILKKRIKKPEISKLNLVLTATIMPDLWGFAADRIIQCFIGLAGSKWS